MRIPNVTRETLKFTAAGLWAFAAIVLLARAAVWVFGSGGSGITAAALGIGAGLVKSRLVFLPMAERNLQRIELLSAHKQRVSLLAVQNAKSYVLIAFMIGLGIALRYSPVPRAILAGIYIAIGTALLLGSLHYLRK